MLITQTTTWKEKFGLFELITPVLCFKMTLPQNLHAYQIWFAFLWSGECIICPRFSISYLERLPINGERRWIWIKDGYLRELNLHELLYPCQLYLFIFYYYYSYSPSLDSARPHAGGFLLRAAFPKLGKYFKWGKSYGMTPKKKKKRKTKQQNKRIMRIMSVSYILCCCWICSILFC